MASHQGIVVRALTWNLFSGRDHPPNDALRTWRSRILRVTERDDTHAQVNRRLLPEFGGWLAARGWDVALLQEAPPTWLRPLAERCGASGAIALTSRNTFAFARAAIARWSSPAGARSAWPTCTRAPATRRRPSGMCSRPRAWRATGRAPRR